MSRYSTQQHQELADEFNREGIIILRGHFSAAVLQAWAQAFAPLLATHVAELADSSRGAHRHYVTLPLTGAFADEAIFNDDDILAIVEKVAGPDPVMCQFASDTPMLGSDYQALHRDTPALFPEAGFETPSFQLAVNFPLCDVTLQNGPFETTRGTHRMLRDEAFAKVDSGDIAVEAVPMQLGDVMIRDVRALHRGTPNRSPVPRPMVVIGYSRSWMLRPEVHIDVPQATWDALSPRARQLLRFNPVVQEITAGKKEETYKTFMY